MVITSLAGTISIGRLGAAGLVRKSCARRVLVRLFECRRFGLGIAILLVRARVGGLYRAFALENYCFFNQSCLRRASGAKRGSVAWVSQRHSSWFRFAPQLGHRPRQSPRQMAFI